MPGIIVITGRKCIEAASQPIDGGVEIKVIVVWEDDVERPVELGGG
jgi:hypothetical protein